MIDFIFRMDFHFYFNKGCVYLVKTKLVFLYNKTTNTFMKVSLDLRLLTIAYK